LPAHARSQRYQQHDGHSADHDPQRRQHHSCLPAAQVGSSRANLIRKGHISGSSATADIGVVARFSTKLIHPSCK
jgi:hypothetical protein